MPDTINLKIEHHAVLFALLAKHAILSCGDAGQEALLDGVTNYGLERGARMASNAAANLDPITTMTSQAYGEWIPGPDEPMTFGQLRIEPTFQTYITTCAWCTAWKKHGLLDYGKYYCVNIDKAVYKGFCSDFTCTPSSVFLSFGGDQCVFDWGNALTKDEVKALADKKAELGTSCMKDFNFHTAHLLHTVGNTIKSRLGSRGEAIVNSAADEYISIFGKEYYDVLAGKFNG